MITFLMSIIIAYVLGSISCSILLAKFIKLPDPRETGSGNAGAANMMRLAGRNKAAVVLIGDLVKGLIAVLIGRILEQQGFFLGLVALAAVVGHIYPVFFKFKGGKGVATGIGSILALSPTVGIIAAIIWAIVIFVFRYASLASLIAIVLSPFLMLAISHNGFLYFLPVLLMAALIVWKHWDNIGRLRNKTEPKVDFKNSAEVVSSVEPDIKVEETHQEETPQEETSTEEPSSEEETHQSDEQK